MNECALHTQTNSSSKNPMQPSSLHYSSLSTKVPDSLLRMLYDMLLPHQLGDLSLTCKALHASVDDAIRQKSVQQAQERSKHAEVLANGAFRLYTSLCRSTVDIRVIPGTRDIIPEAQYYVNERPLVSMLYEGMHYIGRGPHLFQSEALELRQVHNIFTQESLSSARSVRVRDINRIQDTRDPNLVWTIVRIGVEEGGGTTTTANDVEYFATISFAPLSL